MVDIIQKFIISIIKSAIKVNYYCDKLNRNYFIFSKALKLISESLKMIQERLYLLSRLFFIIDKIFLIKICVRY